MCWLRQLSDRLAVFVLFRSEFLVCKISQNKPFLRRFCFRKVKQPWPCCTLSNDWLHFLETKMCLSWIRTFSKQKKLETKSAIGLSTIPLILYFGIVLVARMKFEAPMSKLIMAFSYLKCLLKFPGCLIFHQCWHFEQSAHDTECKILGSISISIPLCHFKDLGSIPTYLMISLKQKPCFSVFMVKCAWNARISKWNTLKELISTQIFYL